MQELKNLLSNNYDIDIQSIDLAPRGFVGETYIVSTSKDKYFLKVFKNNRYFVNVLQSLPVLKELKELGITYINSPIPTQRGDLYIKNEDRYYILFNFIEGKNTWDYDKHGVYEHLIQIHKSTDEIRSSVKREDFRIEYAEVFEEKSLQYKNIPLIATYLDEILKHWESFKELSRILQERSFNMYITHGDAFGNIIKDKNDLYIIDWDDLLLAPIERDLWFFYENERIAGLYKEEFPGFNIDKDLLLYYIYKRFFDDLLGFFELLEKEDINKEDVIKEIQKDCFDWTYKMIKKITKQPS